MTGNFLRRSWIILLITLCTGCSLFIQEPRVVVKDVRLTGLDSAGITVDFRLGITNPNAFDLSLLGYSYDVSVASQPLSSGETRNRVVFPASSESDIQLPVQLKFRDLLEIIKRQPDPDRVPYQMNARLQLDTPLGETAIPVVKNSTFSIPQQYRPEALINNLRDALRSFR